MLGRRASFGWHLIRGGRWPGPIKVFPGHRVPEKRRSPARTGPEVWRDEEEERSTRALEAPAHPVCLNRD